MTTASINIKEKDITIHAPKTTHAPKAIHAPDLPGSPARDSGCRRR